MGSGIQNSEETYRFHSKDWPEGSYWTLRTERTGDDIDQVAAMISKTVVSGVDKKKVKEILKSGESLEDYVRDHVETVAVMSEQKAFLGVMGVKVEGELFTVPEGYKGADGNPHPLAGQLIPQPPRYTLLESGSDADRRQYDRQLAAHLYWIGKLDPDIRNEAYTFFTMVWAGGDAKKLARFRGGGEGVDGPAGGKRGSGEARVPGGTANVQAG